MQDCLQIVPRLTIFVSSLSAGLGRQSDRSQRKGTLSPIQEQHQFSFSYGGFVRTDIII